MGGDDLRIDTATAVRTVAFDRRKRWNCGQAQMGVYRIAQAPRVRPQPQPLD